MELFWKKVQFTGTCWIWTAYLDRDGYGLFRSNRLTPKSWRAHRLAYALEHGSVPPGHLDHLCRNRACVRPSHLEPVTPKVNAERGMKAQQTHCKNGHEFTEGNTYLKPNGTRACRTCHRDREKLPEALQRRAEAQLRYSARLKERQG